MILLILLAALLALIFVALSPKIQESAKEGAACHAKEGAVCKEVCAKGTPKCLRQAFSVLALNVLHAC